LTAYATFTLAVVAVAAILAPIIERNRELIHERRAVLRQFRLLLVVYERRLNELANDSRWRAKGLLSGLDTVLAQVLSSYLARLIPHSMAMTKAYMSIIEAHTTLVLAVQQQETGDTRVQELARKAIEALKAAGNEVFLERAKYDLKAQLLFPNWFKQVEMVQRGQQPNEHEESAEGD